LADLPDWLRLPDGFADSGDPVDGNPFPRDDPRHQVWQDATRRAEEEWARVNAESESSLTLENALEWGPTFFAARFDVWAKRGIHVVWSDGDVEVFDEWLVAYADATLKALATLFERRPPPFAPETVLLLMRNAIGQQVQHWKAEARRYRREQEEHAGGTSTPVTEEQPQEDARPTSASGPDRSTALTVKAAARMLGVHEDTLHRMRLAHRIKMFKPAGGRQWRVLASEVVRIREQPKFRDRTR
jgi:excisionase family DNA binding protein